MKTLYLDTFSGISGDMFIGALLDLGVDFRQLEAGLAQLGLGGYHLHAQRAQKRGIEGVKFDVHLEHSHEHEHGHSHEHGHPHFEAPHQAHKQDHGPAHEHTHVHAHAHAHDHDHDHGSHAHSHSHDDHGHEQERGHGRTFAEIRDLIHGSSLSSWVKEKAVAVFQRIANAEGKIHGCPPESVAFHEVGAVDSIVDIVGGCIGLELLGRPRVLAAAPVEGTGWVNCAHGRFPIPAPATLAILGERGVPLTQTEEPHELITPTGAAILAEFAEGFGPMQCLVAEKIGYGIGTRENKSRPNVLRAVLGAASSATGPQDWETDRVVVLETNLDDITSEVLGYVMDQAFAKGALDVFHTPIQMKKNRPGVLLSLLCAEADADRLTELLLRETSAFGVRRHTAERRKLARENVEVNTAYGVVSVKLGRLGGRIVQAAPEYETCKRLAEAKGVPLKDVYSAALRALGTAGVP